MPVCPNAAADPGMHAMSIVVDQALPVPDALSCGLIHWGVLFLPQEQRSLPNIGVQAGKVVGPCLDIAT